MRADSLNTTIWEANVMRPRLIVALHAAAILAVALTSHTLAHNWGAGDHDPADEDLLCTLRSEPQYWLGECSANGDYHRVYILSGIHANLANAISNSIDDDYNSISGFTAIEVTQVTSSTDAIVFYGNYNENLPIAYTYCPTDASIGLDGRRYHMWCQPHYVIYQNNTNKAINCWNDGPCRRHYACHELGHTTGLQHTVSLSNPDSCMSYASSHPGGLRVHDKGHLTNCYPHPSLPLPTFPAETRSASCKSP
jgi:hypothetical protein